MTSTLTHTAAIILAAGKGTRMAARAKNKVAYSLNGRPMIAHTLANLQKIGIKHTIVVIGFRANSVRRALGNSVEYVVQKNQLGTGDALKTALPRLDGGIDTVLSVYGDDSAFYPPELYRTLVSEKISSQADVLVLTIHKDNPSGLGRIVRGRRGQILRIVEDKNATAEEKKIQEINTGFYCFDKNFLIEYIPLIKPNPVTREYYLTDLVEIALAAEKKVVTHFVRDSSIWHGVNTRKDLRLARNKYRQGHA